VVHVNTVKGPVGEEDLGQVLMHEHVFILTYDFMLNYPEEHGFREETEIRDAITTLNELKAQGIDTIVDLTVMNMGRYIPRLERVARHTDLNIVVATGMYIYETLPMPFHYQGPGSVLGGPEILTDLFVRDIESGIEGTSVRAGIIKCATDEAGLTPDVERVLRAAAGAHTRTGAPISTHTHARSRSGDLQLKVFRECGVDFSRVIIGHSGDTDDFDYLTGLLEQGVTLGMDRFGSEAGLSTGQRIDVVAELCRRGFADKLVLSHDAACFNDFVPRDVMRRLAPDVRFTFILERVVPGLRERGTPESDITAMLVDNPRRLLSSAGR
jgi:phosphotriesterase-related protein